MHLRKHSDSLLAVIHKTQFPLALGSVFSNDKFVVICVCVCVRVYIGVTVFVCVYVGVGVTICV